jgi:hypothetical protein
MTSADDSAAQSDLGQSNPFSTRFTRPGELRFLFPAGESPETLIQRLSSHAWHGQIIGPHGSGKSTLLANLTPHLERAGRKLWIVRLVDRQRSLPVGWQRELAASGANLLVIDGYEQLSRWQRALVRWQCRRRGCGLLVTAHADVGLPMTWTTKPDLDVALDVVHQLTGQHASRIPDAVVAEHFRATGGNLRETLFRLYDDWQSGSQQIAAPQSNAQLRAAAGDRSD